MIKTETTKKITVSYENEEVEILKKAADILQKIYDGFSDEGFSGEIRNTKSDLFYLSDLDITTKILYTLSNTFYLFSEEK